MTPDHQVSRLRVGDSRDRKQILDLLQDNTFDLVDRLGYDDRCAQAYKQMRLLNARGFSARRLWEHPLELAAIQELTAVVNPSLSMLVATHHFLAFGAIRAGASGRRDLESQIDAVDALDRVGTFVITESGYGNSHARLSTRLDYDEDANELVLSTPSPSARKIMSANGLADVAKCGVVIARLFVRGEDRGVVPVLVPLRDEYGIADRIEIEPFLESSQVPMDYARLSFRGLRLPVAQLLHPDPAALLQEEALDPDGRTRHSLDLRGNVWIAFSLQLAAVARAAVTIAVRHAFRRVVRSQDPDARSVVLADLRSHNGPVLRALATTFAMTSMVNRAAVAWAERNVAAAPDTGSGVVSGRDSDPAWTSDAQFGRTLSLVRMLAARQTEAVTGTCVRRLGAAGVFDANRIAAYHGLSNILHPAAGDVHLTALAAMREMAVGSQYSAPTAIPDFASTDFLDPISWVRLMAKREDILRRELRRSTSGSARSDVAWERLSRLGIRTVDAHVQRLQMDAFAELVAETSGRAQGLDLLLVLHGIATVEQDAAWYVARGLLTFDAIDHFESLADHISDTLLPQALRLVDLFGLSDRILRAPILN